MRRCCRIVYGFVFTGLISSPAIAGTVYSDDFNADTSANFKFNSTQTSGATPSSDATFVYDYSALGIPAAPRTTDGSTLGVRLRPDGLGTTTATLGAVSLSTNNITSLPSQYTLQVDIWTNYIGGTSISSSGSNGTTAAGIGVGTAGVAGQSPLSNDGLLVSAVKDGGTTNSDYRIYNKTTRATGTEGYYAAGTTLAAVDNTNAYYSFLGTRQAPTVQQTSYASTQGGTAPVGVIAFAWRTFSLSQDGSFYRWYIDSTLIGTVPNSAVGTLGGSNVSILSFDTNATASTAPNGPLLNADIFDNLTIVDQVVPEPATFGLVAMAGVGLLARRRRARA